MTTTPRGGPRPNAGRPTATPGGRRRKSQSISLDAAQVEIARRLGAGNISEGVRAALDAAKHASARRIEVWQHRTSGDRYAILIEGGRPVAAYGPMNDNQAVQVMAGGEVPAWDEALADEINEQDEADENPTYRRVWPAAR